MDWLYELLYGLLLLPVLPDLVLSIGWPLGYFMFSVVIVMFTGGYPAS